MARPREFDRDEVLDKAIEVFWTQGYDGTSVQDLVDAMGIQRGSLYAAFGDKHQLFLEALDRYENVARGEYERLEVEIEPLDGAASVAAYLYAAVSAPG